MTITFNEIPADYAVPGSYGEITMVPSATQVGDMPLRVLVLGQQGTGLGNALVRYKNVSASTAKTIAGAGSALAAAIAALVSASPYVEVDMVMVAPEADAKPASATLTFTGKAGQNSTAAIWANGVRVPFVITTTMQAADMASAAAAAFTDDVAARTGLTAAAVAGVLTLTSVEKGAFVNDIDVRLSTLAGDQVPGVAVAVTDMTGGAGTPDLTPAINLVTNVWYTDIATCLNDATNLTALSTDAERRYGAMTHLDTHVYFGFRGTYGAILALTGTLNSRFMSVLPAARPKWAPWIVAAVMCGVAAQALNNDPARQLRTLELTGLTGLAPDDTDLFDDDMRNVLLKSGASTFLVGQDGTVRIERLVTNYQKDASDNADKAWRDIMVPKTGTRIRYDWNTFIDEMYPRAKLADDTSTLALQADGVVTPTTLKGSWAGRLAVYEAQGWVEDSATYAAQATFELNSEDRNRCDSALPVKVIGSLITLANSIQLQA